MRSRYDERAAAEFVERHAGQCGEDLALRTYTARLLGAEKSLVLHGGGNTSLKGTRRGLHGEEVAVLWVKGSGLDLATLEPSGHAPLDLAALRRLRGLEHVPDPVLSHEVGRCLLEAGAPRPSLETPVHAFLAGKFLDHTHADAVLGLTNQPDGKALVEEVFGDELVVLDYLLPGFALARESARAVEANPGRRGLLWMRHGLVTWGETARDSYEATVALVTRAEEFLARRATRRLTVAAPTSVAEAQARWRSVAPLLRGALCGGAARPRVVLRPWIDAEVLELVDSAEGRALAVTPPLTTDHLIRTKALPLWIDRPQFQDEAALAAQLRQAVEAYAAEYRAYVQRHAARMPEGLGEFDALPRVLLLPELGCVCAGPDVRAAEIARDITVQTLRVKKLVACGGSYQGLEERHLFDMEYRSFQHAKLRPESGELAGHVSVVTGAAGAIGSGICKELLARGGHVAVTDLAGERLERFVAELRGRFGERVLGVPLDVTEEASVHQAFARVGEAFGGVDLVVANAGDAHVASLEELPLEAFQRLERINVEGTLLLLREAAHLFRRQGIGGDVVLISTKNVFAPGARFGAYSATKAAAHQLARIASLELAELDVRVNMVAPDAVFSEGATRSGLWERVGPDRMRARGLTEAELEEYYRTRNLLKARITARHVAHAVLFFATRQTPTTGATLPVDGGLPDATPR